MARAMSVVNRAILAVRAPRAHSWPPSALSGLDAPLPENGLVADHVAVIFAGGLKRRESTDSVLEACCYTRRATLGLARGIAPQTADPQMQRRMRQTLGSAAARPAHCGRSILLMGHGTESGPIHALRREAAPETPKGHRLGSTLREATRQAPKGWRGHQPSWFGSPPGTLPLELLEPGGRSPSWPPRRPRPSFLPRAWEGETAAMRWWDASGASRGNGRRSRTRVGQQRRPMEQVRGFGGQLCGLHLDVDRGGSPASGAKPGAWSPK